MTSLHPNDVASVKDIHPDNLPEARHEHYSTALNKLVDETDTTEGGTHDISKTILTPGHTVHSHPWLGKYIPGLERFASKHHVGNFVVVRETREQFFESMPIYARLGMHLLFCGKLESALVKTKIVEDQLREQSIKEGVVFDSLASVASIPSFIETYSLEIGELLVQDIKAGYKKLKHGVRPVQNADNPRTFCSAADCRLTVFENITDACKFWVKGRQFTFPELLAPSAGVETHLDVPHVSVFENASLAIFRLAPADYHRFHSPADVIVGDVVDVEGQYYTVNPQAVNEPGFDVFTANRRSILYLTHELTGRPIAFVAIGALLVGSIHFTVKKGDKVKKGEELGYFAYGGSTVITVFPERMIKFDGDLVEASKEPIETLMKVWDMLCHRSQYKLQPT
ncbi:phosphatidylserine decarboxylase-domain-containing protein [Hysterangium stoloniferum]|nr:phosphatidylserine decarboxylase-domain-containing protein [Hysterangium stoloniferum]